MPVCPRCLPETVALATVPARGFQVLGCHDCGGVFVDNDVFKVLVVEPRTRAQVLRMMGPEHPRLDDTPKIACPGCGEQMKRQRAGQVALDVCKRHGIWFDHTELEQVVAQMLADGMVETYTPAVEALRQRLREDARLADARARIAARQAQAQLQARPLQANGEPPKPVKKPGEKVEAAFAVLEVLGAIFEIFA